MNSITEESDATDPPKKAIQLEPEEEQIPPEVKSIQLKSGVV